MNVLRSTAIGLAMLALTSGAAFAESGAMMKTDSMAAKPMAMSAKDKKMMTSCQAMPHDKMMKNAGCKKMAKMHPDMMKGGAMMKSDGAMAPDTMMKK